ncbi:AroM family protein [Merdimmobilis hominis]|jgi:protein AroM|uniref:AroM family protein n=1 Tax=Merdimmobilis hominis TaxID=2897707 RepID=UPI0008F914B3|nr:AroM family protein [Merdimmobilis hominis]MCD4836833.1 AroM family protein [Merdimmobilis hominis]PWL57926.1 MAG: AroM family protein [Oscillospiraceae bacterium]
MEKVKIGAITVGQSPRVDVTPDLWPIFGPNVELIEAGGLDGLSREEIETFVPEEGDYVLVSRLKDGSSVTFAERYVLPRLQQCIDRLEEEGVRLILFFCTGDFPDNFRHKVPLIFPNQILFGLVPVLCAGKLAAVTPSEKQLEQSQKKWGGYGLEVKSYAASPYGEMEAVEAAAREIAKTDADLVLLDCIGYTAEMKRMVAKITGKNVILSRTILARAVMELLDY